MTTAIAVVFCFYIYSMIEIILSDYINCIKNFEKHNLMKMKEQFMELEPVLKEKEPSVSITIGFMDAVAA